MDFVKSFFLDLLFPRLCFGCGKEGRWICSLCLPKVNWIKFPFCPNCRKLTIKGEYCQSCAGKFFLSGMIVCARYDDAVIKKAIHHFKYEHFFDIGRILGKILAERLATEKNKEGFLIIPVPLHNLKKAQRGFNQAEILAKVVALSSDRPYLSNILVRQKYRRPQMELSREKRLENLKGSFCWLGGDLKRAEVILVDDVATTGATLEECAKVLKKSGAGEVWGLVLAHG